MESTETAKDSMNHAALTSRVTKQPTTTEEGVMTYECSACGYTATKPIAKIAKMTQMLVVPTTVMILEMTQKVLVS
ncbi:MAG: hypothetical protein ACLTFZ_03415 [Lachnospiraceae bacterium]